jgi:hypothetical protein
MIVLGVMAFAIYKLVVVDRMGFCYKRLWFVSSEELIIKTIDGLMKSGRMKLDAADTTPQAYLAHHPDCCRVEWGGGPFRRGLIYFGSVSVMVSYEINRDSMSEDYKEKYQTLYYEHYANMTACGESVGDTGMSLEHPINYKQTSNK